MQALSNLFSCDSCGVVVDFNNPAMERKRVFSHDQDEVCEAVVCPVCKEPIPDENWIAHKN